MIKRILILVSLIAISVYLVLAITLFNSKPKNQVCEGMELVIKDNVDYGFISIKDVESILKSKKLIPVGQTNAEINVSALEEILDKHPFVKDAECYLTAGGKVKIDIYQRIPLLRVISGNGDNYYLDSEGEIIKPGSKAVHVPIATGYIDRKFAQEKLFELAVFLNSDEFWKAQIEQVNVTPKQEIELVPRVGDHVLFLGKPELYKEKFNKLKAFYTEGLNKVGWNKYDRISIEFSNQIICTKKEK